MTSEQPDPADQRRASMTASWCRYLAAGDWCNKCHRAHDGSTPAAGLFPTQAHTLAEQIAELSAQLAAALARVPEADRMEPIEQARDALHQLSPVRAQPVDRVRWVAIEKVEANDYNPNSVARTEMGLLQTSILHDGYTQPIVTVHDVARDRYVIVDGFHRFFTCKSSPEILARNRGLLPIVVLQKGMNDRMAATVRHNRARGKHSVAGMANMVFSMLERGWDDAAICRELGMEAEELLRLKHVTGFSKLFENNEYRQAWATKRQIMIAGKAGVPVL